MSVDACGRHYLGGVVQIEQQGCSFKLEVQPVGVMTGVLQSDTGGTFAIDFNPPCAGRGSGGFSIGPPAFHRRRVRGSWTGTIDASSTPPCPCAAGPTSGVFFFDVPAD